MSAYPPTLGKAIPNITPELHSEALFVDQGVEIGRAKAEKDEFGVYLDSAFRREASIKVSQEKYAGRPAGLAMADLDGLKAVNDDLGHPVGDSLIIGAKTILRDMMADEEVPDFIAGRVGGDEFAMLVFGDEEQTGFVAKEFQKRYRELVEEPENGKLKERGVALSIGHSNLSDEIKDLSGLMRIADERLYDNKVSKLGELSRRERLALLAARGIIKLFTKKRLRDAPKLWRKMGVLD